MNKCPNCNVDNPDTARFCMTCGASLVVVASETVSFPDGGSVGNGAPARSDMPKKLESHLVKAIIATVCCCLPFGIVAIVYAAQVNSKLQARDLDGAIEASQKANLWSNLSIGIGIIMQILWVGVYKFTFNSALFELLKTTVN